MVTVKIPFSEATGNGTFSDLLKDLVVANTANLKTYTDPNTNMVVITNINASHPLSQQVLTPTLIGQLVALGGDIEGFPVFFKMAKDYAETTDVPSTMPNSIITSEDGTTTPVKWINWHDSTHQITEYDDNGVIYVVIPGNSFGEELPASKWPNDPNIEIMTTKAYLDYNSQFTDNNI